MVSSELDPSPPLRSSLSELTNERRMEAMTRFAALRPYLEEGTSLVVAALEAGVALRTAQRWLARYRDHGLLGLTRRERRDAGRPRTSDQMIGLVQGLALRRPRLSAAAIHRKIVVITKDRGWAAPSYAIVYAIIRDLDPARVTLAQDGPVAWRNRYELIHRHRAERPNAIWQADHTMLDIAVLGPKDQPERPWLTVVMDDHSRAVAGYSVFAGVPSMSNLSLALRQAIWRKGDAMWPVCGVPNVLHVNHGSDVTSSRSRHSCACGSSIPQSAAGRAAARSNASSER